MDGRYACYVRKPGKQDLSRFVEFVNMTQCRPKARGYGGLWTHKVYTGPAGHSPYYYTCKEKNESAWLCAVESTERQHAARMQPNSTPHACCMRALFALLLC